MYHLRIVSVSVTYIIYVLLNTNERKNSFQRNISNNINFYDALKHFENSH